MSAQFTVNKTFYSNLISRYGRMGVQHKIGILLESVSVLSVFYSRYITGIEGKETVLSLDKEFGNMVLCAMACIDGDNNDDVLFFFKELDKKEYSIKAVESTRDESREQHLLMLFSYIESLTYKEELTIYNLIDILRLTRNLRDYINISHGHHGHHGRSLVSCLNYASLDMAKKELENGNQ